MTDQTKMEQNVIKEQTNVIQMGDVRAKAWQDLLDCSNDGSIKATFINAVRALENDPALVGSLRLNTFTDEIEHTSLGTVFSGRAGSLLTDANAMELRTYLQELGMNIGKGDCHEAIEHVAHKNRYNPVRDYLGGLAWDG